MTKPHATGWTSESPTSAQLKEFFAQIANGRITKTNLQEFLTKPQKERFTKNQGIFFYLGAYGIRPDEISDAYDIYYEPEQLDHLFETIPRPDNLNEFTDRYLMLPGPPKAMTLGDIYDFDSTHFCKELSADTNDVNPHDRRVQQSVVMPGWLLLRKFVYDNTCNFTWEHQQKLLLNNETVPNIAEIAWAIIVFMKVRSIALFKHNNGRTATISSDGDRLYANPFGSKGLRIATIKDYAPHNWLGLFVKYNL